MCSDGSEIVALAQDNLDVNLLWCRRELRRSRIRSALEMPLRSQGPYIPSRPHNAQMHVLSLICVATMLLGERGNCTHKLQLRSYVVHHEETNCNVYCKITRLIGETAPARVWVIIMIEEEKRE